MSFFGNLKLSRGERHRKIARLSTPNPDFAAHVSLTRLFFLFFVAKKIRANAFFPIAGVENDNVSEIYFYSSLQQGNFMKIFGQLPVVCYSSDFLLSVIRATFVARYLSFPFSCGTVRFSYRWLAFLSCRNSLRREGATGNPRQNSPGVA